MLFFASRNGTQFQPIFFEPQGFALSLDFFQESINTITDGIKFYSSNLIHLVDYSRQIPFLLRISSLDGK